MTLSFLEYQTTQYSLIPNNFSLAAAIQLHAQLLALTLDTSIVELVEDMRMPELILQM